MASDALARGGVGSIDGGSIAELRGAGATHDPWPQPGRVRANLVRLATIVCLVVAWGRPTQAIGAARWVPGEGRGTTEEGRSAEEAAAQALLEARRNAVAAALDDLGASIDPRVRRRIVEDEAERWTRSFRIVSQVRRGTVVEVRIEADVDLARLVRAAGIRPGTEAGRRAVEFDPTCDGIDRAVRRDLEGEAGTARVVGRIVCHGVGAVRVAGRYVARAELVPVVPGESGRPEPSVGIGTDPSSATTDAVTRLARRHRLGRTAAAVVVGPDLPTSFVRRLANRIPREIPSTRTVRPCKVAVSGRPVLCIEGTSDLAAIARVVAAAGTEGGGVDVAVDGARGVVYVGARR